eukprot:85859_1
MQAVLQKKQTKIIAIAVAVVTLFIVIKRMNKNKYKYLETIFDFMVRMGERHKRNPRLNTDKNIQLVNTMQQNINNNNPYHRIIRFISEEQKDEIHYGLVCNNETPKPGSFAQIISTDNIYDKSSWNINKSQCKILYILPPIDTHTIYCIGLNYASHAKESGLSIPTQPVVFMKPKTSVISAFDDIIIPKCHLNDLDHEVELVVIIGKKCKNVSIENAMEYVFGYSIGNDVTCRKWQITRGGGQWCKGKGFDTFCPFGPCVVINDGDINGNNLNIWCKVNGKIVQFGNTNDLIFSIEKLVSFLSKGCTLEVGTIILTGTPSGVGVVNKPFPRVLHENDLVECGIEHIGILQNRLKVESS